MLSQSDSFARFCAANLFLIALCGPVYAGCMTSPSGVGRMCGASIPDQPAAEQAGPQVSQVAHWHTETDRSAMDDTMTALAVVDSNEYIPGPYGNGEEPAKLVIRCFEDKTLVQVYMAGHFMASIQGYGRVDYRIDDQKATHVNMLEDTSNKVLGLWYGSKSIPFVKSLYGHERLLVRVTPFNEQPIEVTFQIGQAETATAAVREACHWD